MIWIRIEERTPELGDYSVLVWFEDGVLQYTKWYLKQPVTHWAYVNTPKDLL